MLAESRRRRGQRGSTLILFTLMLPLVLIPMVGLAIDAAKLRIVQAKLSAAVDGASLGAGRLLGTTANSQEIATEFLNANFPTGEGFWSATNFNPTVTVTIGTTKTIAINATASVPLFFGWLFGQSVVAPSAASTATRRDSRVELVIDRSGSMNTSDGAGSTVIADVRNYAKGFAQRFLEGSDELGLVVFDGSAVVGYPTVQPWDSTTTSTSTGGPDSSFNAGTTTDMIHEIGNITASSGTGMAEALSMAYIELQKAHLKDLAANGVDTRLNSIVLFTDGVPSAVSLYLNDNDRTPTDNAILSTSACTNKNPTKPVAFAKQMLGWLAIAGPPYSGTGTSLGFNQLASLDTTVSHTVTWWMQHGGSDATSSSPNWSYPTNPAAEGSCSTSLSSKLLSSGTSLSKIPSYDKWGNSLNPAGSPYTNSYIVESNGQTSSIYTAGQALVMTQPTQDYDWGLAMWNAVDGAAKNIRLDGNLANRAGDTQNMAVAIYAIGYMGNGGIDQGLLLRVANDKTCASYSSTQPQGIYVAASNANGLASAFNTIAAAVLRLSQ
ncbi:MAG: VWA domain-containing protein [Bryobacteraceae bacterium]|jgi:hypothetical protein